MAGARAAASLSLTIGVAFATVLVVGGILAGPSVVDCSHQGGSIGACLRDKVQHSGLVPAEIPSSSSTMPNLSSEAAPPPAPAPVVVTPIPVVTPHDEGWIDARANEYEPAAPAQPEVDGAVGGNPQVIASAELVPSPAVAPPRASGGIGREPQANGSATLAAEASEAVQLGANGDIGPKPSGEASAALVAEVDAPPSKGSDILAPPAHPLSLPPLPLAGRGWGWGRSATGAVGSQPSLAASASPVAEASEPAAPPVPSLGQVLSPPATTAPPPRVPAVVQRPRADVKPRPAATPKGPPRHLPAKKPPRHIFKNDPRFPNVTVLPAPATGANSSFATLMTH